MKRNTKNDLFVRAARGERTPLTPIWLMRQAGRTDPEYVKLKDRAGLPLERLFRHPELAAEISLLPRRIGVDAIIFFQDILIPLAPMGAEFVFAPGPVLSERLDADALSRLHIYDVGAELPFVPETFRLIRHSLDHALPVLGFAGAPLTLAMYLIEGQGVGDQADKALSLVAEQPHALRDLLNKLTTLTIDYLKMQIEAGAAAVQLFESLAHLLSADIYREFALPYQQQVFDALKGLAPTILFARKWSDLEMLHASGADILSLGCETTIAGARDRLGRDRILQGNLDNKLLAYGTLVDITDAARGCVISGGQRGHIFNLSHGLLRETPFENVVHLIKVVHETTI
ncbi:MAG: uroporphyrinogen decarboxylase [Candidatus Hydrogenedentes bacterium]|nr:uroporphyrinogen decarboxylase [Candidatus Hydrogenedentota bacterium]